MNKIFLGAVFGLTIIGSAGASIISRGFFDEKIADYATMESLNSKADKSELTTLSEIIGNNTTNHSIIDMIGSPFIYRNPGTPITPLYNLILDGPRSELAIGGVAYGLRELTSFAIALGSKTILDDKGEPSTFYEELIKTKQVANEAKELAEKAIPNVLNESSNGKYVLTAEKVGDVATYKWEIIDRTVTENTTINE